jgi:hypothetical protein
MRVNVVDVLWTCSESVGHTGPGASKKIEQEASGYCHYSEYLTLLNTSPDATTRDRQSIDEYNIRGIVDQNPPNN